MRIDVSKHVIDVGVSQENVKRANEENEWQKRLGELAALKKKAKKLSGSPKGKNERQRVSAHQLRAIRRD